MFFLAGVEIDSGKSEGDEQQRQGEPLPRQPGNAIGYFRFGLRIGQRLRDGAFADCIEIVGDGRLLVDPEIASVGADKTLIEDAAGKLLEVFVFESLQHAGANLRSERDVLECDALFFPFLFEPRAKGRHSVLGRPTSIYDKAGGRCQKKAGMELSG